MGPWSFVSPRLTEILPRGASLTYVGRDASASPATGNASIHKAELARLLETALG
jgi:2-oxoglutarate dehydrogenase E1 component